MSLFSVRYIWCDREMRLLLFQEDREGFSNNRLCIWIVVEEKGRQLMSLAIFCNPLWFAELEEYQSSPGSKNGLRCPPTT